MSDNEQGFCIEYKNEHDLHWQVLDSVPANQTSLGPIHMETPGVYAFKICAFNGFGKSAYTDLLVLRYTGMSDESLNPSHYPQDTHLPVEISSFTASILHDAIVIEWSTESEVDHRGFILERRAYTEEAWHEISSYHNNRSLSGQGNTSERREYAYTDRDVIPDEHYFYRLSDVDVKGNVTTCDAIFISCSMSTPSEIELKQAFPNPFNSTTTVMYQLSESSLISIQVFDVFGRLVKFLYKGRQSAGIHHIYWHGRNQSGCEVASGKYFISLMTERRRQIQKVTYVK